MMRDRAIVITKLRVGKNAIRGRGKRAKIAKDVSDFAAIWPLPEDIVISKLLTTMTEIRDEVAILRQMAEPLFTKLSEKGEIDQEIAERRQIVTNLEATQRRISRNE